MVRGLGLEAQGDSGSRLVEARGSRELNMNTLLILM